MGVVRMQGQKIRASVLVLAMVGVLTAASGGSPASAVTVYTVTTSDDHEDGSCASDCSLREAIIDANNNPGADVIILPDLAGDEFVLDSGEGDLFIDDPLTIKGDDVVIRQNVAGQRVFHISLDQDDPTLAVRIENVTITGGEANASNASDGGGGVKVVEGDLTLVDSIVAGNVTTTTVVGGGGIQNANGTLTIISSEISGNDATAGPGGGIFNHSGIVNINNSTISDNDAAAADGGGIHNVEGTVNVVSGTFVRNSSGADGGAIYQLTPVTVLTASKSDFLENDSAVGGGAITIQAGEATISDALLWANEAPNGGGAINISNGEVAITNSVIRDNLVATFDGGGIRNNGTLTVERSTIADNSANSFGGGLYNVRDATIRSSAISGNDANHGGGIFNDTANGVLVLENSTVSGNETPGGDGTGVFVGTTAQADIANSTISGNAGGFGNGGGLFTAGTTGIAGSVLAGNTATIGPDCNGTVTSGGFNVIGNVDSCTGITNGVDNDVVGDPTLEPLAFNGGPTQTHAIGAGSLALNHNDGAGCGGSDQRGVPRPGGANCDSGAYELSFCKGRIVNVVGTNGKDVLHGTAADDGILALGGRDVAFGYGGDDGICGGGGKDKLFGGAGRDFLHGGGGTDKCVGGSGKDKLKSCERGR